MAKKKTRAQEVFDLMKKAEASKAIIAKERDALRNVYKDLEDILETVDDGLEGITEGLRYLSDGIDRLSEQL